MSQTPSLLTYLPARGDYIPWEYAAEPDLILRGRFYENPGKPILHMVHGTGFSTMMYWPFLRLFMADYALFLHDIAGHGESDPGDGFPGGAVSAQRVAEVFHLHHEQLGAGRDVIGMGHSLGGALTIGANAYAMRKYQHGFSQLVLLDSILIPPSRLLLARLLNSLGVLKHPMAKQAAARRDHWPNRRAAWDYLYQRGILRGWTEEATHAYLDYVLQTDAYGELSLRCPPWFEAQIFSSVPPLSIWAAVKAIAVPALALYGEQSYDFMPASQQYAAKRNAHIELQTIAGQHCYMQENPQQAYDNVTAWLSQFAA